MKPSLKNKLTADKIEAANRLLVEQNQDVKVKVAEKSQTAPPSVQKPSEAEKVVQNVEKAKTEVKSAPKKTAKTTVKTIVEEPTNVKMVRVTIDIPENIHEKMKIKMILSKQTIKQYLLDFIEKDLAKSDFKYH
jgi:dsDNA-specific endonuclease/ATPase MutS2